MKCKLESALERSDSSKIQEVWDKGTRLVSNHKRGESSQMVQKCIEQWGESYRADGMGK